MSNCPICLSAYPTGKGSGYYERLTLDVIGWETCKKSACIAKVKKQNLANHRKWFPPKGECGYMRDKVTAKDIDNAIEGGWDPTWFSIDEDGSLKVDFCCHYKLPFKTKFLECTDHTPEFVQTFAAKMKQRWIEIVEDLNGSKSY